MNSDIKFTIKSDLNGYFSRECPNNKCLYPFKIFLKDWNDKVSGGKVYCPKCGCSALAKSWWTQNQLVQMNKIQKDIAQNYINDELNKSFNKLEQATKNTFIKMTVKNSPKKDVDTTIYEENDDIDVLIICSSCGTHFSVDNCENSICPCCGTKN